MGIWDLWTAMLEDGVRLFSGPLGLSQAAAIIALTLLARIALSPLSLAAACQAQRSRRAMERIKPALERLQERFKDDPQQRAAQTLALYQQHGVRFFGKATLFNLGAQSAFGIGFYQALRRLAFESKFLWIANLARPDVLLALLAGALMFVAMLASPEAAQTPAMLLLPVAMSIATLLVAPSAIALYWATSNAFGVLHALVLRWLLHRGACAASAEPPR